MAEISRRALLRAVGPALLAGLAAACDARRTTREPPEPPGPRQAPPRRPRRDRPGHGPEGGRGGDDPDAAATEPGAAQDPATADGHATDEPSQDAAAAPDADPVTLEVLCRDAWAARPARPGAATHAITGMMLHHSAVRLDDDRQAPQRMRLHQRHHQDLGWADIAYHLGVDRRGHVYALRDPGTAGETATAYDPSGWLLVMAEGNYDEQEPTEAQLDAIGRVLAWGAETFALDPARVATHRDVVPTTRCPGQALHEVVASGSLAARVANLLAVGVVREDLCGDAAERWITEIEAGRA